MSLVDYASSSDEEDDQGGDIKEDQRVIIQPSNFPTQHNHPPPNLRSGLLVNRQAETSSDQAGCSLPKLPDASFILNSPVMLPGLVNSDHSYRVAAARAENESRKRESELASTDRRSKVPKGDLLHSRSRPDTATGLLRPPQLGGRSNVVTEDISKLFVRRPSDPKPI